MFAKVVMRGGHVGRGKHFEFTRYLVIETMVDVLSVAQIMPRVKKNHLAVISCEQISRSEYLEGKLCEAKDPYLNTYRNRKGEKVFAQNFYGEIA